MRGKVLAMAVAVAAAGLVLASAYRLPHEAKAKALEDACDCDALEVVTTSNVVVGKHGQLLGRYHRMSDSSQTSSGDRPTYKHSSGKFFLYYSENSQGFWAVGERIGSEVVRLENQGDRMCPYYLKSTWRYADGEINALVYDVSLRVACMSDPCSVAQCGHQSSCRLNRRPEEDPSSQSPPNNTAETALAASCECRPGFVGNPYDRCFPASVPNGCGCERLVFSSTNRLSVAKHVNNYGEYFLFDVRDGQPVYQHFAGIEYLYRKDGHWLVSNKIGLHEAGLQNQGESDDVCPYRFRTSWEYADIERAGWQWIYDHTARLTCPNDPCSIVSCGFHASCTVINNQGVCACDAGYRNGNPYERCYPEAAGGCGCKRLFLSSAGPSVLAQSDKMGRYFLYGYYNGRPAYQHESGLDYLFYAVGEAWVIGATFGGARVGIVNFDKAVCPHRLNSLWRHSVRGKLETDPTITMTCIDEDPVATTTASDNAQEAGALSALPPSREKTKVNAGKTTSNSTKAPSAQQFAAASSPLQSGSQQAEESSNAKIDLLKDEKATAKSQCDCPRITVTSQNPNTVEKHGSQLGGYKLQRVENGRPVYKHNANEQYMYYHPHSGGNWLINSEVGLLYGGIQNSKDAPACPYLINTVWQYGDSTLGGWVYDESLRVTCPTDPCSVLSCGFRAQCAYDSTNQAHCVCRPGHSGNPAERCYPAERPPPCSCLKLRLASTGPAKQYQADKMGDYHLWGYHNNRTVYQHESGLDFLYRHSNEVWGVGPKVGGNSAGLLNFGRKACPYELTGSTPWEFGTRLRSKSRQVDRQLTVTCLESSQTARIPPRPHRPEFDKIQRQATEGKCGLLPSDWNGRHPWQAAIHVQRPEGGMHLCSAAIVSERHVLTLASCVTEYAMKKYRVRVTGANEREQEFAIQSIFTHDSHNEGRDGDVVALVKLRQRAKNGKRVHFGHSVRPACLETYRGRSWSECSYSGWEQPEGRLRQPATSRCKKAEFCFNAEGRNVEAGMSLVCWEKPGMLGQGVLLGLSRKASQASNGTLHFLKTEPYLKWVSARLSL